MVFEFKVKLLGNIKCIFYVFKIWNFDLIFSKNVYIVRILVVVFGILFFNNNEISFLIIKYLLLINFIDFIFLLIKKYVLSLYVWSWWCIFILFFNVVSKYLVKIYLEKVWMV